MSRIECARVLRLENGLRARRSGKRYGGQRDERFENSGAARQRRGSSVRICTFRSLGASVDSATRAPAAADRGHRSQARRRESAKRRG